MRPLVKPILGERVVAKINYKRGVRLKASWEGVFNKQHGRKEIFDEIVEHFDPATIVETGTFRGTTTEYMSGTTANVFSLEFDPSNAGYAQARLAKFKNVQVINLDSRSGHKHLIRTKKLPSNKNSFIYLDAHWNEDLPLRDELQIVFEHWTDNLVVMIDDFCVPDDRGYTYDDYGQVGARTIDHIADIAVDFNIDFYFPTMNSSDESGSKRGCVVLAKNTEDSMSLFGKISSIRRFTE